MDLIDLHVPPAELRASACLPSGQTFSWKEVQGTNRRDWVGVIGRHVVHLKETETTTLARILNVDDRYCGEYLIKVLTDFFQLTTSLKSLYERWSQQDDYMQRLCDVLPGVRVLSQDPFETIISFLCSSNNNIPRITLLIDRLRRKCGDHLLTTSSPFPLLSGANLEDFNSLTREKENKEYSWYAFPRIDRMLELTETRLREMGFGYRARSIVESVAYLRDTIIGSPSSTDIACDNRLEDLLICWFESLRKENPNVITSKLLNLRGIGRKVADCISLFSFGQTERIPVDTHVLSIARCRFGWTSSAKSITPSAYEEIGNLFRQRYGPYAGWAHTVLFTAELSGMKKRMRSHDDDSSDTSHPQRSTKRRKKM